MYNNQQEAQEAAERDFGEAVFYGGVWSVKPLLLKDTEVAEQLQISVRKVWQLNKAGKLPKTVHPPNKPGFTRWRLKDIMPLVT